MLAEVRRLFGNSIDYYLVGHSKGGLVAVDYISKNAANHGIKKVITFGTPYNVELINSLAHEFEVDKTLGDKIQMGEIRDRWNSLSGNQRPSTTAVGTGVFLINLPGQLFPIQVYHDGLVSLENACGENYSGIFSYRWIHLLNQNYRHSNMLGTYDALSLVFHEISY